jgi:hypothetical protein
MVSNDQSVVGGFFSERLARTKSHIFVVSQHKIGACRGVALTLRLSSNSGATAICRSSHAAKA